MRPYIILLCALIVVITLNCIQVKYLEKSGEKISEYLNVIKQQIENENFSEALQKLQELDDEWQKVRGGWDVFTEHDDVEEIGKSLASLKAYLGENEKVESINEIAVLEQRIKHILENERLSFATIF